MEISFPIGECIYGKAGHGKTYTAIQRLKDRKPTNPIFCTYRKEMALKLSAEIPNVPKKNIGTIHKFALQSLYKNGSMNSETTILALPSMNSQIFNISGGKVKSKSARALKKEIKQIFKEYLHKLKSIFEAAYGKWFEYRFKKDLMRYELTKQLMLSEADFEQEEQGVQIIHSSWLQFKKRYNVIDFSDMLLQATSLGEFDFIVVDECQDLSPLLLNTLKRLFGRIDVFCGDPNQAIYGYMGARPAIFQAIQTKAAKKTLLKVGYRCCAPIQEIGELCLLTTPPTTIPKIESGLVREVTLDFIHTYLKHYDGKESIAILTKTNRMSQAIYQDLLPREKMIFNASKTAKKFYKFLGGLSKNKKDPKFYGYCESDMKGLIKRTLFKRGIFAKWKLKNFPAPLFDEGIQSFLTTAGKKALKSRDYFAFASKKLGERAREQVDLMLEQGFSKTNSQNMIGTIHSAKGDEWDVVFIVNGDPFPKISHESGRVYYVACTRAKSKLFIIQPDSGFFARKALNYENSQNLSDAISTFEMIR